jgi:hypothetical protein
MAVNKHSCGGKACDMPARGLGGGSELRCLFKTTCGFIIAEFGLVYKLPWLLRDQHSAGFADRNIKVGNSEKMKAICLSATLQ